MIHALVSRLALGLSLLPKALSILLHLGLLDETAGGRDSLHQATADAYAGLTYTSPAFRPCMGY